MKHTTLVGPGAPYLGRNSYRSRTIPLSGWFHDAVNVRGDSGIPSLRPPRALLTSNAPGSGTFRGGWVGTFKAYNAYTYSSAAFAAIEESGEIRIYRSVLSGTWQAWSEITGASGKYGDTRLTAGDHVTFQPVPGEFGSTALIVQVGEAVPLRIDLGNTAATDIVTRIESITKPDVSANVPVAGFKTKLNLAATVDVASESGTSFSSVAATNSRWVMITGTGLTATDTATFYLSTSDEISAADSEQLWILCQYQGGDFGWWDHVKVEAVYGGTPSYVTVHDPTASAPQIARAIVPARGDVQGKTELIGFPVKDIASTIGADFRGLRFTVMRTADLGAARVLDIYAVGFGGRVPGGAQYAVSFENGGPIASGYYGSKTESPGVVLRPSTTETVTWAVSGLESQVFPLPISEEFFYYVNLPAVAPSSTDGGRGVNFYNVYRRDPGESEFYFVSRTEVVEYSGGSWVTENAIFSGTSAWGERITISDNVLSEDRDTLRTVPGAKNEPVPQGVGMTWANRRLHVGSVSAGTGSSGALMVSDFENPYRFRRISSIEQILDGHGVEVQADERVTAVKAASASSLGQSRVYVWTTRDVYDFDGLRLRRLSGGGCLSPFGVTEQDGVFAWIDPDKSIRVMDATIRNISRHQIDPDLTAMAAGRHQYASLALFRERLFVSHTGSSGSVNDQCQVYNFGMGAWESRDTGQSGQEMAQIIVWNAYDSVLLLYFGHDGKLYRAEDPSATLDPGSSQITFNLKGPYLSNLSASHKVGLGPMRVVCTDKASESLATKRVPMVAALESTVEDDGTIDIDAASGESFAWKIDKNASTEGPVRVDGYAVAPEISGTLAGPFSLHAWSVETHNFTGYGESA